jgi:glycosyltransferase involved in cell wall biosynthesis
MRIGFIIYGDLNTRTGGYIYDKILVQYLRDHGEIVDVFSLPWRNYFGHLTDNLKGNLFAGADFSQYDLLIEDELTHPSLLNFNRKLMDNQDISVFSIVHLLRFTEAKNRISRCFYQFIEKSYFNKIQGLIFNSLNSKNVVNELINKNKSSIIAYPGRDTIGVTLSENEIGKRSEKLSPIQILFFGNVIRRKGLHVLLQSLKKIESQNWHLNIVGHLEMEPLYVSRIKRMIAEDSQIKNRVTFYGSLIGDRLVNVLKKNQLLVMPSFWEGFGMVYIEGMGFGLPAIATNAGATNEIIKHGANGFLIDPGDSSRLAEHIDKLVQDRELLLKMSLAALDHFYSHPTWDETCEKIHKFLMLHCKSGGKRKASAGNFLCESRQKNI